ncbi:MAG TPA: hypothetical protein VMV49_02195 [Candidatus Deferrimicrobium sp.]|nr:hypothetical protein [Candidatus Deferrimicrobium sp.]
MAEFPIEGIFREPILLLEVIIIFLGTEFGFLFLYRFIKEKKSKNYMNLAWAIFFLAFSGMVASYIFSDLYATNVEVRQIAVNIGYTLMAIGTIVFTFNAEREVGLKRHLLSIFLIFILIFLLVDFFIWIIAPVYLALVSWLPFIITLLLYITKLMTKVKEYRYNIYGFFIGFLAFGIGYAFTVDAMATFFGFGARMMGDISIILGMCLISFIFLSFSSMRELNWAKNIKELLIMHKSGTCICDHNFMSTSPDTDSSELSTDFMAGSLMGISQMISELIQSKEQLETMDHQDKKIIFAYGEYLIAALIVEEYLEIYKKKLKNLIEDLELLYKDILQDWKGELFHFKPVRRIITRIFS